MITTTEQQAWEALQTVPSYVERPQEEYCSWCQNLIMKDDIPMYCSNPHYAGNMHLHCFKAHADYEARQVHEKMQSAPLNQHNQDFQLLR